MITGTTIKIKREREREWEGRRERGSEGSLFRLENAHNKSVRERESERQWLVRVCMCIWSAAPHSSSDDIIGKSSCTKTNFNCALCLVLCAVCSFVFFSFDLSLTDFVLSCPVLSFYRSCSLMLCVHSAYCLNCLHCTGWTACTAYATSAILTACMCVLS